MAIDGQARGDRARRGSAAAFFGIQHRRVSLTTDFLEGSMDFSDARRDPRALLSIERFMDEFVYPLERSERWRMEVGGPGLSARRSRPCSNGPKRSATGRSTCRPRREARASRSCTTSHVNEILGRSPFGPACVGSQAPDSGNAEILWRFGDAGAEEALARAAGRGRYPQLLLDDGAGGCGLRSALAPHHGGSRRRSLRRQRSQVVLERCARSGVRDRHGGDAIPHIPTRIVASA